MGVCWRREEANFWRDGASGGGVALGAGSGLVVSELARVREERWNERWGRERKASLRAWSWERRAC